MSVRVDILGAMLRAIPRDPPSSIVAWCEEHLALPLSAKSKRFDPAITPWIREPMETALDRTVRRVTFVKPIQSGGSTAGEGVLCYLLATQSGGDVQYNWQNDLKADERWDKRVERILRACEPVMARWPADRLKSKRGLVIFPHDCSLTMQGILTNRSVASDSVRFQINEELHDEDGWLPGRLRQATGRLTAYWDHYQLNISNAGRKNSELHREFEAGTQQHWEEKCPGCGQYHVMRGEWRDNEANLGGLRYTSDGCKDENGRHDYTKLARTIRYQMPCGYEVRDDVNVRRELSLTGRYGPPTNTGAAPGLRSYTLEAVSVYYIPWLTLIEEKHAALKALRCGDPEPWREYLRERECKFADDNDRPVLGKIILSDRRKDRAGLAGRTHRFSALDRQQGSLRHGEMPHWWLVIRDVDARGNSLLVWEGKCLTDEDAVDVLRRHEVRPQCVVVDSGDDTTHVYQFCLTHGFNAIKGGKESLFAHPDGGRRIFSPERPLYLMLNGAPTKEDPLEEPQFWFYSKAGIRDRLAFLRASTDVSWEVPCDVSSDYQSHMESEELQTRKDRDGHDVQAWVQVKDRNDLFVCECYIAMLMEMAGIIGAPAVEEKEGARA